LVARPQLLQRLEEGLALHHRLTLASAPAGFGKTTLLSHWLHQTDRAAGWLSLDEGDNDLTRFLAYLIAALQRIDPAIGQSAQAMLQASQPPSLEPLLTSLINEIAARAQPAILVLDDYHVIETTAIHQALTFLLDHLPSQMHLVIASRADPPLPLARLRGRGQLTELHATDLRFNPDEVGTFLNDAMALGLSAEEAQALAQRTEGWITGLQLAALSIQGRDDVPAFIEAFAGSHRYILDYLTEEVLSQQPREVRDFLLRTAILTRLCGGLCDAVRFGDGGPPTRSQGSAVVRSGEAAEGRPSIDSQAALESLERNNLFVVPLDDKQEWYRYHHLFADLLRQRLQQENPDLVPVLHRRASEWYEQQELMAEAVSHALTSGDLERAAGLIQQTGWATFTRGEMATILHWMDDLPDEFVRSQPRLSILRAWAMAKSGQMEEVEPCLRGVDLSRLPGEASAVRAYVAGVRGDLNRAIQLSEQALKDLPADDLVVRAIVAQNLGVAHHWSGNPAAASRILSEAVTLSRAANQAFQTLTALAILGRALEMKGALCQARETYQEALDLASGPDNPPVPFAGMAYVGLARLSYEWNDLDSARRYALQGISLSERGGFLAYQVFGYALLAWVYRAQGDNVRAARALEQAERLGQGCDYDLVMALVADARVRWWVAQGDLAAAARWAREQEPVRGDDFSAALEIRGITVAWVMNAQQNTEAALPLLSHLLDAAEAAGRRGSAIKILALQALALAERGDTRQSLSVLERALSLAAPEGYVRAFVDEGRSMAHLLSQVQTAPQGTWPDYVDRLLAAFDQSTATAPVAQALIEPLTERELEVLHLIATGLSNREIAQELVIAISTVKSHIHHIYGKLGVESRTQAMGKAQALDLL
jgi:LuxR family maltose regulon positive regulatory protein